MAVIYRFRAIVCVDARRRGAGTILIEFDHEGEQRFHSCACCSGPCVYAALLNCHVRRA